MSPRNCSQCPQCRQNSEHERQMHEAFLAARYGKVSQDEYESLKRANPVLPVRETLGEYYEWEFTSKGKFWFCFHFVCDVCGFRWGHKAEIDYPLNKELDK